MSRDIIVEASSVGSPITIVIGVAVRLYRDGLAAALDTKDRFRIAGVSTTSAEVQTAVREFQPDVVLIDVSLDGSLMLTRTLHEESSSRVLVFAVQEDITAILRYAEAGADGFVTANSTFAELVEAIERSAAGELLCSPRIAAQLLRRAAHQQRQPDAIGGPVLTIREQQVFSLLRQGQSNKEIGSTLHIAEATVKNHVHHVLEKLRVATRGQAVAAGLPPLKATLKPRQPSRTAKAI